MSEFDNVDKLNKWLDKNIISLANNLVMKLEVFNLFTYENVENIYEENGEIKEILV